ncbi:ABC transporter ATP-binding protein [Candidatus Formimonas warabiya]|uniref:ABC transporter domain-containing protein n=1 Tax=Formimonas warabiya TaxID=1761012 RepID=A0A3G1KS37_FORW1|nr:ABC transporter ATP-binding protein [Candidatus Formimonas warabiya]ATW25268.1 hypothetical protein DCMF_11265 [Candidatus Formimonas warabiya]
MEKLLRVRDLEVHFATRTSLWNTLTGKPPKAVRAVDGISFDLAPGEILGLAGESGSGKTTTGKGILRLVEPTAGSVNFLGEEVRDFKRERLRKFRRDAQIILQDPFESLNPRQTVFHIVAEPLKVNGITHRIQEQEEIVDQALVDAGLDDPRMFYYRYPHELSGGQRQRVAIASTLVLNPKLVVADEPVSMLDLSISAGVVKLMLSLRENRQISYLFITHELSLAWLVADRIGVMYLGKMVELGTADEIIKSPLHPYTKALVSVIPVPKRKVIQNAKLLQGETPDPINMPPGCRFHPRCPVAKPSCRDIIPEFREMSSGHWVACPEVE